MIAEGIQIAPFWAGVAMTILVELAIFFVAAVVQGFRKGSADGP